MAREMILLLSDIHANEEALMSVIRDSEKRYQINLPIWFIGDLFGRGPAPIQVWERFEFLQPEVAVAGNHDWGVTGRLTTHVVGDGYDGHFKPIDWSAIQKHRAELSGALLLDLSQPQIIASGEVGAAVSSWPLICMPRDGIYVMHGGAEQEIFSDLQPSLESTLMHYVWGYVEKAGDLLYTFDFMDWLMTQPDMQRTFGINATMTFASLIIVGHYHYRRFASFETRDEIVWINPVQIDHPYPISPSRKTLISPGSVGFPYEISRDAAYAVLELVDGAASSITFHAVAYDRAKTQREMRREGYPHELIARLDLPNAHQNHNNHRK